MDGPKLAPTVGLLTCILTLVVLACPYLLAPPSEVTTYYASGALSPLIAGLFALVAIIVFAAGREERADPALSAGAALVLGLFVFGISVAWAVTARVDVLTSPGPLLPTQRWVLAAVTVGVPTSAGWYARTLRVV